MADIASPAKKWGLRPVEGDPFAQADMRTSAKIAAESMSQMPGAIAGLAEAHGQTQQRVDGVAQGLDALNQKMDGVMALLGQMVGAHAESNARHAETAQSVGEMAEALMTPRTIRVERGADGKIVKAVSEIK
jgi:hypothetical protein